VILGPAAATAPALHAQTTDGTEGWCVRRCQPASAHRKAHRRGRAVSAAVWGATQSTASHGRVLTWSDCTSL